MASLNARIGALTLITGAAATFALSFAPQLVPLRFVALGLSVFGAWAFVDEMGIRKPLNRAGFVAFTFAAAAKTTDLLGLVQSPPTNALLLYAFSLLMALLLWSLAFLHRDGPIKLAGAVGASFSLLPIVILIAGHIFVGVGAFWGVGALYAGLDTAAASAPKIITIVELIYAIWAMLAALALWSGKLAVNAA